MAILKQQEQQLLQAGGTSEMPRQPSQASVSLPLNATNAVASQPHAIVRSGLSKCPRYNGETEWCAFLVQFQAWLRLNHYDGEDCRAMWCDLLGLALDGEAQLFYSGLSVTDRARYETLIQKLEQRYSGIGVVEVYRAKLQSVPRRQPGESIEKLRDSLWLMARKAYPALPREAQEQLALDALMRAVEHDLRIQCTMKECKSLDEAVAVMQRYEAVQQVEPDKKKKAVKVVEPGSHNTPPRDSGPSKQVEELCHKMADMLQQQLKAMEELKKFHTRKRPRGQGSQAPQAGTSRASRDECFRCGQKGHFIKNCPQATSQQPVTENASPPAQ